jgi:hypothetical protein
MALFDLTPKLVPRWKRRLEKERAHFSEFLDLSKDEWRQLLKKRSVTSSNQDTVLALDWPHYCAHATSACGGSNGWCYTFQGNQSTKLHDRHVAMVDTVARQHPTLFADKVADEVGKSVVAGRMDYPNLRYSGSGEATDAHLPALKYVTELGVHLWGFTRNIALAKRLRSIGCSVIVSCDRTSPDGFSHKAHEAGFRIAYSSEDVADLPPLGTIVTFPVHRGGKVREVVDIHTLCPKVVSDFVHDSRQNGTCQSICNRCHKAISPC